MTHTNNRTKITCVRKCAKSNQAAKLQNDLLRLPISSPNQPLSALPWAHFAIRKITSFRFTACFSGVIETKRVGDQHGCRNMLVNIEWD